MKYFLKNNRFADFSVYEQNKLPPCAYFIPFSERGKADAADVTEERYCSDVVRCLSGAWDFVFYENPTRLPDVFDTDTVKFDTASVPSCWQYTGYAPPFYHSSAYQFRGKPPLIPTVKARPFWRWGRRLVPNDPYNYVGVYRTFFEVNSLNKYRKLSFLGVCSSIDVYLNGQYVGYSEGSHNTAEFAVNDFVKEGQNELVVAVRRWSTGTYLEAQDMFRNNGIFRDVLFYELPKTHIYDYVLSTEKTEGGYNLTVTLFAETPDGDTVELFLDTEQGVRYEKVALSQRTAVTFDGLSVKEWSAEQPDLYKLLISVRGMAFRAYVGFRTVSVQNAVYLWNGQPIKFFGVNHHDTSPTAGYTMTVAEMKKDVLLMKEFFVNAVRMSHYPPDPVFLQLCMRYGLYVIDEADIETHGMEAYRGGINAISRNPRWLDRYEDRVRRMFFRDRNFCCIGMWSLGNESGGRYNQDRCYELLKKVTDIPVHYEHISSQRLRPCYDIMSEMYASPDRIRRLQSRAYRTGNGRCAPYFLCEYAHSMGVGPGSLHDYVRLFRESPHYLGGCIWEWADHAYLNEKGRYTYGGDNGEFLHDGNFCMDGLFYPDRTPSRSAYEMKSAYFPVLSSFSDGQLTVTNDRSFSDTSDITVCVALRSEEKVIWRKMIADVLLPKQSVSLPVAIPPLDNVDLLVRYLNSNGEEVAANEWVVRRTVKSEIEETDKRVRFSVSDETVTAEAADCRFVFDKKSCTFVRAEKNGNNYCNENPVGYHKKTVFTELYHAPFDNDRRTAASWHAQKLNRYSIVSRFRSAKEEGDNLVLTYDSSFFGSVLLGTEKDAVTVHGDGTVEFDCTFTPVGLCNMARFGKSFEWDRAFTRLSWYGRGECESYPDFFLATKLGRFERSLSEREPYLYPQHNGTYSEVSSAALIADDGRKILFSALDRPFFITAQHATEEAWERWKHLDEVTALPTSVLTVDGFFRGVGSNSCGPLPLKPYLLASRGKYRFRFAFRLE